MITVFMYANDHFNGCRPQSGDYWVMQMLGEVDGRLYIAFCCRVRVDLAIMFNGKTKNLWHNPWEIIVIDLLSLSVASWSDFKETLRVANRKP
jgi:hypothetical protein